MAHLSIISIEGVCGVCGTEPDDEDMWSDLRMTHLEKFSCRECKTNLWACPTYNSVFIYTRWKHDWARFDKAQGPSPTLLPEYTSIASKAMQRVFMTGWRVALQFGGNRSNPYSKSKEHRNKRYYWQMGFELCLNLKVK